MDKRIDGYFFHGDRVEHDFFGRGRVVGNTYGRVDVRVRFDCDYDKVDSKGRRGKITHITHSSNLTLIDEIEEEINWKLKEYPLSWEYIIRAQIGHIKNTTSLAYQLSYPYVLCNDIIYVILEKGYDWREVGTKDDIIEEKLKKESVNNGSN